MNGETNDEDETKFDFKDFVFLPEISIGSFVKNLRIRFGKGKIYTNIDDILISVNPYRSLPIYDDEFLLKCRRKDVFNRPAHIFSFVENVFQTIEQFSSDSAIVILGESGSGKSEAAKIILRYILSSNSRKKKLDELLMKIDVVLESFGHGRTSKNDNSTRLGKIIEIRLDFKLEIQHGKFKTFLLEKNRIVKQKIGERNFHCFYQLLTDRNEELGLNRPAEEFFYLNQGQIVQLEKIDDQIQFENLRQTFETFGFDHQQISTVWKILAAILHLGNFKFVDEPNDEINFISKLLECPENEIISLLNGRNFSRRDALSKALYERLFRWLIRSMNEALRLSSTPSVGQTLGIVDVFGFENFETNDFEQISVNFCSEKLEEFFLESSLKFIPGEFEFDFSWNKRICEFFEEPNFGIFSKFDGKISNQNFYNSKVKNFLAERSERKNSANEFVVQHFSTKVFYSIENFVEKNPEEFSSDFQIVLSRSENPTIRSMWLDEKNEENRRSSSRVASIRNSMKNLLENLREKEKFFVRCLKTNEEKSPQIFNVNLVENEILRSKLVENVLLRQKGFFHEISFDSFLRRFGLIDANRKENRELSSREKVLEICRNFRIEKNFHFDENKIFFRTRFSLEKLEIERHKVFLSALIFLQKNVRRWKENRPFRRYISAKKIQRFYTRIRFFRYLNGIDDFLKSKNFWPKVEEKFSTIDEIFQRFYRRWRFQEIFKNLNNQKRSILQLKFRTGKFLRERCSFFDLSVAQIWRGDYLLSSEENFNVQQYRRMIKQLKRRDSFRKVYFSSFVTKFNSYFRMEERAIVLTEKFLYKLDPKKDFQAKKPGIPLEEIRSLNVTFGKEQLLVFHLESNNDLIVYLHTKNDRLGELVAYICKLRNESSNFSVNVQRKVSAFVDHREYIINIIWDRTDQIQFVRTSSNNITLTISDEL